MTHSKNQILARNFTNKQNPTTLKRTLISAKKITLFLLYKKQN